jgi:hypothetical protein
LKPLHPVNFFHQRLDVEVSTILAESLSGTPLSRLTRIRH